jgi:hypothetical protein
MYMRPLNIAKPVGPFNVDVVGAMPSTAPAAPLLAPIRREAVPPEKFTGICQI